ncbi:MAG: hypothetical protein WC554_11490 [Clostridia bacterium]
MKNYVIIKNADNKIESINEYDENKVSIEEINKKIFEWDNKNHKPEVVIENTVKDILEYMFGRINKDEGAPARYIALESAIEDISRILDRLYG